MRRKTTDRSWRGLALITQISLTFLSSVLISLYLGYTMDNYLKTTPLFFVLFLLLGIGAGFLGVYRLVKTFYGKG